MVETAYSRVMADKARFRKRQQLARAKLFRAKRGSCQPRRLPGDNEVSEEGERRRTNWRKSLPSRLPPTMPSGEEA